MPATSDVPLENGSPDPELPNEIVQERFATFSVVYIGLFILLVAYLASVQIAEYALSIEFQERVNRAVAIDNFDRAWSSRSRSASTAACISRDGSPWADYG